MPNKGNLTCILQLLPIDGLETMIYFIIMAIYFVPLTLLRPSTLLVLNN